MNFPHRTVAFVSRQLQHHTHPAFSAHASPSGAGLFTVFSKTQNIYFQGPAGAGPVPGDAAQRLDCQDHAVPLPDDHLLLPRVQVMMMVMMVMIMMMMTIFAQAPRQLPPGPRARSQC